MFVRQDERRKEVGRLIQQVPALDVGDDCPRVPCMLWDISAGGARLAPQQCAPGELPDKFFLLLAGGSVRLRRMSARCPCKKSWAASLAP